MSTAQGKDGSPTALPRYKCAWAVVLPVKPWGTAKSRLASDPQVRAELARAFVLDVLAAVRVTAGVAGVLLVSRERALHSRVQANAIAEPRVGADRRTDHAVEVVVADDHGDNLDDSVRYGAQQARRRWPEANVAVVTSDLPSLQPDHLAAVLSAAAGHDLAAVADTEGTGTTVLTATEGADLRPAYGVGSFARHRRLGAADITWSAAPGVRRDVDVEAQLADAERIGVGTHTAALLMAEAKRAKH